MKRLFLSLFLAVALSFVVCPTVAYADWTYGTAYFKGDKPRNCLSHGTIIFYYNGTLKYVALQGNTEVWECTGDVCVIFPKNYSGRKVKVKSAGTVQIQNLR